MGSLQYSTNAGASHSSSHITNTNLTFKLMETFCLCSKSTERRKLRGGSSKAAICCLHPPWSCLPPTPEPVKRAIDCTEVGEENEERREEMKKWKGLDFHLSSFLG